MTATATMTTTTGDAPGSAEPRPPLAAWQQAITALFVVGPLVGLGFAVARFWGRGVTLRDLVLAFVLYQVTGHGVTVGFHRLFTHKSFTATRPVKIAVAVAGSMAFQGGVIGWVANHRVHHARSDRDGDPHSPVPSRPGLRADLAGLWHAHTGWLFRPLVQASSRVVSDLRADPDLRAIERLFPLFCVISLALPFAVGWAWAGDVGGGVSALLWAGLVRVCVLHHVTWSINSICHRFGRRPFATRDRSTNVRWLALASFGESWHNNHHAFPRLARHGVARGQLDTSAAIIRLLERLRLVAAVRWPERALRASG